MAAESTSAQSRSETDTDQPEVVISDVKNLMVSAGKNSLGVFQNEFGNVIKTFAAVASKWRL